MITEIAFAVPEPSVGNLVASGDKRAAEGVLNEIALLAIWVYGTIAVMLLVVIDDFIAAWIGDTFVLGRASSWSRVLNFYMVGMMARSGPTGAPPACSGTHSTSSSSPRS